MSTLDVIAVPARLRILRALNEHEAAGLEQIAELAGIHANTARAHLHALEEAHVIEREAAPATGRGRPAALYRLRREWSLDQGYRGIAELLGAALEASNPSRKELRSLGTAWGRLLGTRPGPPSDTGSEHDLPGALEQLGFDARVEDGELRLGACPCPLVSPSSPELVCTLVDAVAEGVLAGAGSKLRLTHVEHDPERRVCRATLAAGA